MKIRDVLIFILTLQMLGEAAATGSDPDSMSSLKFALKLCSAPYDNSERHQKFGLH